MLTGKYNSIYTSNHLINHFFWVEYNLFTMLHGLYLGDYHLYE